MGTTGGALTQTGLQSVTIKTSPVHPILSTPLTFLKLMETMDTFAAREGDGLMKIALSDASITVGRLPTPHVDHIATHGKE